MPKARKAKCPYCGKRVSLTSRGLLHAHLDPETKNPCNRKHPN